MQSIQCSVHSVFSPFRQLLRANVVELLTINSRVGFLCILVGVNALQS